MILAGIIHMLVVALAAGMNAAAALVPAPPGFVGQIGYYAGEVMAYAGQFDAWIPVSLALSTAAFVLSMQALAAALVITRMVISYFTFGGGATS